MIKNLIRYNHVLSFSEKYNNLLLNYLRKININEIKYSLSVRNETGNIPLLSDLIKQFNSGNLKLKDEIFSLINDLPNLVSTSTPVGKELDSKLLKESNIDNFSSENAQDIGKSLSQLRAENVFHGAEARCYYLNGDLAKLERAILRYTLDFLLAKGFKLISVPDIINENIVRMCGFISNQNKNQIYSVITNPNQIRDLFRHDSGSSKFVLENCLSGTSEMALAALVSDTVFEKEKLPVKLCALSRCYRRESSRLESHLYRVHQFNKIEMFCVTSPTDSEKMFEDIVNIQDELFNNLEFGYRILEMASEELGMSAYRKVDIESWMPGENRFGEISSASNCTDYQSRHMNIFYQPMDSDLDFAHTLNGTGCAIPRILKTIIESRVTEAGHIIVPEALIKYMGNVRKITRQFPPHKVTWIPSIVNKE